jgi:hypothetical protein
MGGTIHAISLEPLGGEARALVAGTKKRDRTWAFVLVDTGGGVNITKAEAESTIFGQDRLTIRGYYEEVSYGLQGDPGSGLRADQGAGAGQPVRRQTTWRIR